VNSFKKATLLSSSQRSVRANVSGVSPSRPHHHQRDHLDAARAQLGDVLGKPRGMIEALADGLEARLREALEADREDAGAGARDQVE
jgi:hypothetical protein